MVRESSAKAVRVSTPVIDRVRGARCTVDGKDNVINLASCSFWGLAGDPGILVRSTAQVATFDHMQAQDAQPKSDKFSTGSPCMIKCVYGVSIEILFFVDGTSSSGSTLRIFQQRSENEWIHPCYISFLK